MLWGIIPARLELTHSLRALIYTYALTHEHTLHDAHSAPQCYQSPSSITCINSYLSVIQILPVIGSTVLWFSNFINAMKLILR